MVPSVEFSYSRGGSGRLEKLLHYGNLVVVLIPVKRLLLSSHSSLCITILAVMLHYPNKLEERIAGPVYLKPTLVFETIRLFSSIAEKSPDDR